jgi:DNA-directed RNA polymerase
MQERLEWTKNNTTLIGAIALDPIGNLSEWEVAEEPWQFLAACEEYYHCILKCDRHYTSLPVATDATCSGLQILAGLARDKSTAKLVNVIPSDKPQDAYAVVAETAKPDCPKDFRAFMDRKTVKRTVMTVPYNAKPFSNRSYIREALLEKGVEVDKDNLTQLVKAVRAAMHIVVPGPMSVMKWIEDEVTNIIKRGETELEWCTPSGFVVRQKLMKKNIERIQLNLLGVVNMRVATTDKDEVDINRHKAATAPNLIHSLDASLIHLSAVKFNAPIAVIHDSVLSRATDMSQLSTVVRDSYMHLFADNDYLTDFARQVGAETDPPIIGDL